MLVQSLVLMKIDEILPNSPSKHKAYLNMSLDSDVEMKISDEVLSLFVNTLKLNTLETLRFERQNIHLSNYLK